MRLKPHWKGTKCQAELVQKDKPNNQLLASKQPSLVKSLISKALLCSFSRSQTLPGIQVRLRKGRGNIDQVANTHWIIEKAREFQKSIYFCFIDYIKAFECVDHNKLWKILKEMGMPDHHTCLPKNVHMGQETTIRMGHGTTDWFKIGKEVQKDSILSPGLFNFYVEYII